MNSPATFHGNPPNYKYLRSRKWYRFFRVMILGMQVLLICFAYWRASHFWSGPGFHDSVFIGESIFFFSGLELVKYFVIWIVERGKMWLPDRK